MRDTNMVDIVDEAAGDEQAEMAPQRPFWLVGLALLGLIVVILVGGFALTRRFQPRIGIEPAAAVTALPRPTGQARVAAGTAPPATSASAATATVDIRGLRLAQTPIERDVQAAYQKYLEVYAEAVANLDTSHLSEVLSGQALQWVTDEVNDLKAQGRSVKVIEDDRVILFGRTTETSATLVDEYTSRSVYVDPKTKQPLPRSGPSTSVRQSYEFRKIDGVWKIVDGTRETLNEGSR